MAKFRSSPNDEGADYKTVAGVADIDNENDQVP